MEVLIEALGAILFDLFIPLPWSAKQTKSEQAETENTNRTKYPRRHYQGYVIVFIVAFILFVIGAVLLGIFEKDCPYYVWIAYIFSALLFTSLPLLGIILAFCTYEVVCDDGILVVRPFKKKLVKYTDMESYAHNKAQLTVFDKNRKLLFTVEHNVVGLEALVKQLDRIGVPKE